MSKKFEFECIWAYGGAIGNNYVDENSIDVSIGEPKNLPSFDDFQKLAGKRVRVTIEPLPVAPEISISLKQTEWAAILEALAEMMRGGWSPESGANPHALLDYIIDELPWKPAPGPGAPDRWAKKICPVAKKPHPIYSMTYSCKLCGKDVRGDGYSPEYPPPAEWLEPAPGPGVSDSNGGGA